MGISEGAFDREGATPGSKALAAVPLAARLLLGGDTACRAAAERAALLDLSAELLQTAGEIRRRRPLTLGQLHCHEAGGAGNRAVESFRRQPAQGLRLDGVPHDRSLAAVEPLGGSVDRGPGRE